MATSDDFRAMVVEFGAAHDRQAELAAALKENRARTRELQEAILGHMQAHDIDECEWSGGRLLRKRTKRTEGLKKEHIQGELRKLVGDDASVESAMAAMYNRRLTEEQETLAVVRGRGGDEGKEA